MNNKAICAALTVFFIWIVSAASAQGKLLAKEDQAIPDSFARYKGTMLVINHANFQVRKCLEKTFEKYYTGNYELVDEFDQYKKPYNDTAKYRYVFITYTDSQDGKWVRNGSGPGFQRQGPSSNYSYGVFDRATGKEYHISFFGGAYKGLMEAYVKKLEGVRTKSE